MRNVSNSNIVDLQHPTDKNDTVVSIDNLVQLSDITAISVSYIHRLGQGNCEDVVGAPVDMVDIKVLDQLCGIQDSLGLMRDVTKLVASHAGTN